MHELNDNTEIEADANFITALSIVNKYAEKAYGANFIRPNDSG